MVGSFIKERIIKKRREGTEEEGSGEGGRGEGGRGGSEKVTPMFCTRKRVCHVIKKMLNSNSFIDTVYKLLLCFIKDTPRILDPPIN